MNLFVSPYHLATREPPAMVGLLVARRVVTLVPKPAGAGNRADLERAAARLPKYRELVDRLSWTKGLFEERIASTHVGGADALADVHGMWGRIEGEEEWTPLRTWMRWSLADEPERFLDAVCSDVLRGGPDPGISVPMAAGVDHFAERYGLIVARSHPTSLSQRAEGAFARTIASWSMPALVQAEADRIMLARDLLRDELDDVRVAVECAAAGHGGVSDVREAARAYGAAFADREQDVMADSGEDEVRPVAGAVALSLVAMPIDVALRSSADAAAAVGSARARRAHTPGPGDTREVLSLVVKVMGRDGTKGSSRRASVGG